MKNIALITSKKNTVRSNHYHVTDWHYMYVLSGSFDYYFRPTGSDEELQVKRVKAGEMVFTPPMEDHATVFLGVNCIHVKVGEYSNSTGQIPALPYIVPT